MAGIITPVRGWSDVWGGKAMNVCDYAGPSSYVVGGDVIDPKQFGVRNFEFLVASETVDGTYFIRFRPSATGPTQTWKAVWYVVATGAEVAVSSNLSTSTAKVFGFGL
jgi:hypothetical protein